MQDEHPHERARNSNEEDIDVNPDMDIREFLELPEFRSRTMERNQLAARVWWGLSSAHYSERGIRTLKDLSNYIGEHGWLGSRSFKRGIFRGMGEKSVDYFNQVLRKYGIEPIGPLYRPK